MCAERSGKKPSSDPFEKAKFLTEGVRDIFEAHRPFGRSETGFLAGRSFHPAANIYETPGGLEITLEIPGVKREEVDLKIDGTSLKVSGRRNFVKDQADEEYVRIERGFGSFSRSFEVPHDVDPDGITAKLENGVLTITVPVRPISREIKVEAEGDR